MHNKDILGSMATEGDSTQVPDFYTVLLVIDAEKVDKTFIYDIKVFLLFYQINY